MRRLMVGLLLVLLGCGRTSPSAAEEEIMYRVNCGADTAYVDRNKVTWLADQVLAPGKDWGAIGGGTTTREKVLPIHEEVSPELYRSERFHVDAYEFSVPNGTYAVRLHFSECHEGCYGAGMRVFGVRVGSAPALVDFDPYAEGGGFARPVVVTFSGCVVEDGKLRVEFTPKEESTCINAIEVAKSGPADPSVKKTRVVKEPFVSKASEPGPDAKQMLFIGNSQTIRWNLPKTVEFMVNSGPAALRVQTSRIVAGGRNLEWHLAHSKPLEEIAAHRYAYVVLQEYQASSVEKMVEMVRQYDKVIRERGGRTLLYCTWVRLDQSSEDQDRMNDLQRQVAKTLNVTFVPVGVAWQTVRRERPDLNLHNADKLHPGMDGAYLTTCVFYAVLTGKSPEGLEFQTVLGDEIHVKPETAAYLQKVAWRTVCAEKDAVIKASE